MGHVNAKRKVNMNEVPVHFMDSTDYLPVSVGNADLHEALGLGALEAVKRDSCQALRASDKHIRMGRICII